MFKPRQRQEKHTNSIYQKQNFTSLKQQLFKWLKAFYNCKSWALWRPEKGLGKKAGRLVILHISLNLPVCCLQVVQGDIFSADSLKPYFKGQDVVMSCLGFPASLFSGVTGYTLSMKAVVSAMGTARVSRLITMTSWYTERKHVQRSVSGLLAHIVTVSWWLVLQK